MRRHSSLTLPLPVSLSFSLSYSFCQKSSCLLTLTLALSLSFSSLIAFLRLCPRLFPFSLFTWPGLAWPGRAVAPPSNRALPWLGYLINPTLYSSPPTLWSGRQLFGNLTTIFGYANLQLSNQPRSQSGRQAGANQATNQLPRRALNSLWCAPFYSERSS